MSGLMSVNNKDVVIFNSSPITPGSIGSGLGSANWAEVEPGDDFLFGIPGNYEYFDNFDSNH